MRPLKREFRGPEMRLPSPLAAVPSELIEVTPEQAIAWLGIEGMSFPESIPFVFRHVALPHVVRRNLEGLKALCDHATARELDERLAQRRHRCRLLKLARIVRTIRLGRWEAGTEEHPVVIAADGSCCDGRYRLLAVVRLKRPVTLRVGVVPRQRS